MTEVTLTEDNGNVRFEGQISPDIPTADSPAFTGTATFVNIASTGTTALGNAGSDTLAFYGHAGATQQAVTGALSTVADAPAKAVLTSIIAALVASGLVTNGTT